MTQKTASSKKQVHLCQYDYLSICRDFSALSPKEREKALTELRETTEFHVDGDVQIVLDNELFTHLVPAKIRGDLDIRHCQNLKILDVEVRGNVAASGSGLVGFASTFKAGGRVDGEYCRKLKYLDGEIEGEVYAPESSVERIEPTFKCHGDVQIPMCRKLKVLDGEINGTVDASECPSLETIAPSFKAKRLDVHDCPKLKLPEKHDWEMVKPCSIEPDEPNVRLASFLEQLSPVPAEAPLGGRGAILSSGKKGGRGGK